MDLVRALLLNIEGSRRSCRIDRLEGYEWPEIFEHLQLIEDAGLVRGKIDYGVMAGDVPLHRGAVVNGLSWKGHDFLDAARSDTNWNKAKEITSRAGGWTFELLQQVLVQIITQSTQKAMGL